MTRTVIFQPPGVDKRGEGHALPSCGWARQVPSGIEAFQEARPQGRGWMLRLPGLGPGSSGLRSGWPR